MKMNEAIVLACEKYRYCYCVASDGHVMLKGRRYPHTYPSHREQRANTADDR